MKKWHNYRGGAGPISWRWYEVEPDLLIENERVFFFFKKKLRELKLNDNVTIYFRGAAFNNKDRGCIDIESSQKKWQICIYEDLQGFIQEIQSWSTGTVEITTTKF